MSAILMDKLQMMVKLKEKIYALRAASSAEESEIKRLEKLLKTLQTTPNAKYI